MKIFAAALAMSGLLAVLAGEAAADPLGRDPYGFPARSGSVAVQLQMLKKNSSGSSSSAGSGGGGSGGATSVNQYVTNYSSNYTTNSTAVGNLNEITQILDNGAQGYVGNNAGQTSSGDQGSTATSSLTTIKATATQRN